MIHELSTFVKNLEYFGSEWNFKILIENNSLLSINAILRETMNVIFKFSSGTPIKTPFYYYSTFFLL